MQSEAPPILTISQLTQLIKQQLEGSFPALSLQGEISNFRHQSSGHFYFSLKDSGAQISAVMFRGMAQKLRSLPKDGDSVIIKGALNVYPPRGNYQLVVHELTLAGVGELLLRLEQLKIKLHQQGYFRKEHKKPLPKDPQRLGIVTSPTGAAIQDMLNILSRRQAGLSILLYPVKVQGQGAAEEIAQAIRELNNRKLCDVIIVGRGGGSIEDLWAFNEEIVAQAIFDSTIPVIGAVGHETDHCIAEHVADLRAPTPSAAAELVTSERGQQQEMCLALTRNLDRTLYHLLRHHRERLDGLVRHPLFQRSDAVLGPWLQKFDDLREDLDTTLRQQLATLKMRLEGLIRQHQALSPLSRIAHQRQQIQLWSQSFDTTIYQLFFRKKEKLTHLKQALSSIDPQNLLNRGYSIIFSEKDGSVINSVKSLEKNSNLRIRFADGEANATVTEISQK